MTLSLISIILLFSFPSPGTSFSASLGLSAQQQETMRRRNIAIISHPDSGKTTMTEKILLHGNAIQQAGAVRQKGEQRRTSSDFMKMEVDRGISISATCVNFDYEYEGEKFRINLMDTPGHADFSEDTFRALSAADNALMLLDGGKGLEPQTRSLFEVCRLRRLPLFTFVNKMDQSALSPMEIIDQIESEFGLETIPVSWPIGDGDRFRGIYNRVDGMCYLYEKSAKRGQRAVVSKINPVTERDVLRSRINDDQLFHQLFEDIELLDGLLNEIDVEKIISQTQTPLFFGSALTDFGVSEFLDYFLSISRQPSPREIEGDTIESGEEQFSGQIFKTQANLDPKHRDRISYLRVVSGVYEKGMKVKHSRSKSSKFYTLSSAQQLFGQNRESVENAYPGDVIGINNPGTFTIGDTLFSAGKRETIVFPPIPQFSPRKFAYITNSDTKNYKSFRKGLSELIDEGVVQLFRMRNDDGGGPALLAAVGELQFDVMVDRLKDEYKCDRVSLEPLAFSIAKWATGGWDSVDAADAEGKLFGTQIVQDIYKRPVILFRNEWKAINLADEVPELELQNYALPPSNF